MVSRCPGVSVSRDHRDALDDCAEMVMSPCPQNGGKLTGHPRRVHQLPDIRVASLTGDPPGESAAGHDE